MLSREMLLLAAGASVSEGALVPAAYRWRGLRPYIVELLK